jgi:uncharacterized protein YodC (DUF2158 family)
MIMPFQIADSVQLRNEGPCMVVTKVLQNGKMACCWFDGRELQEEEYPIESLTSCKAIDANARMLQAILYLDVTTI